MSYQELPKPFLVLAPMDDVTDTVFRQVVVGCAPPGIFFTEFVNVDGLQSPGREKLLPKLRFTSQDTPLVAQIWGKNPDHFYKTAKELADGALAAEANKGQGVASLNYAGVDINMGCPDKTICKNGCCAALINNRGLTEEILQAVREGVSRGVKAGELFPISVKTRLGFSQVDMSWPELLLSYKLNMLTIHGRTAKQVSAVPANWDLIGEVRKLRDVLCPSTLVIGNGDVSCRVQALELAKKHQLDGVMIGRGIFQDPFAFAQTSPWPSKTIQERLELFQKHITLFEKTWAKNERKLVTLNKFCKIYVNGFDGAKELREKLMQAKTTHELHEILNGFSHNLIS